MLVLRPFPCPSPSLPMLTTLIAKERNPRYSDSRFRRPRQTDGLTDGLTDENRDSNVTVNLAKGSPS